MGSLLRKAALFLCIPLLVLVFYDLPIFYSRWRGTRTEEQAARAKEAEQARHTIALLGGDQLKILQFYASPVAIRRGGHALICYGVSEAKSVRIEPALGELQPSLARCLPVSPSVSTEYKLLANDGSGHTATQELTIRVER